MWINLTSFLFPFFFHSSCKLQAKRCNLHKNDELSHDHDYIILRLKLCFFTFACLHQWENFEEIINIFSSRHFELKTLRSDGVGYKMKIYKTKTEWVIWVNNFPNVDNTRNFEYILALRWSNNYFNCNFVFRTNGSVSLLFAIRHYLLLAIVVRWNEYE